MPAAVAGETIISRCSLTGEDFRPGQASFQVEDLDAAIAMLEDRGVSMEQYDQPGLKTDERGIVTMGPMRGAWFKDSQGNILGVVE